LRKVFVKWYLHCQDCYSCLKTNLIVDIQYFNGIESKQYSYYPFFLKKED